MNAKKWAILAVLIILAAFLLGGQNEDIFQAVQRGSLESVKALIAKDPALAKAKNEEGDTPLHFAAGAGRRDVVDFLLTQGADPHAKNNGSQTPLLYAAYAGSKEIVAALVALGADFKYQDVLGRSPLHFAAREGRKDVVSFLLEKGAPTDLKNQSGQTPLDFAVLRGHGQVILAFFQAGALDPKSEAGSRALLPIAAAGLEEVANILLEKGADISVRSEDGKTIIHSAAAGGLVKLVEMGLAKGLDVQARDTAGRTALHDAVRNGRTPVVEWLLKTGADPNVKGNDGRSPFDIAQDRGEGPIIAALKKAGAKESVRVPVLLDKYPSPKGSPTITVAYVANEGFRISSPNKTVLVDALVENPWAYDNTPAIALDQMVKRLPPFERIDLLLFSHAHADHFNAEMALRVLQAHPEAALVGNEAVREAMQKAAKEDYAAIATRLKIYNPAWGKVVEETLQGIPLRIFPVNHAEPPQEYQTLAYVMDLEGVTLFHLGDSAPSANLKYFEAIRLDTLGVDIAFLDGFFLRDPVGLEILPKFIQPAKVIPMHLRGSEVATVGPELAKLHPNLVLFEDALEAKTFRKAGPGGK
ncbi:MAG: ankyrin repeat domain-containing protein [Candidatus Aminicenantes bacterium]|nr:ankyrin repeat domain-containing protein [Candidatus Aminicenantes bacterium]